MKKILLTITLLPFALSMSYFSSASAKTYEDSTTSSDYDYIIDSRISTKKEADDSMKKFKEKVANSVSGVQDGIDNLNTEIKNNQLKYSNTKDSEALGNIYGTSGRLEVSDSRYTDKPDFANTITAATETTGLEPTVGLDVAPTRDSRGFTILSSTAQGTRPVTTIVTPVTPPVTTITTPATPGIPPVGGGSITPPVTPPVIPPVIPPAEPPVIPPPIYYGGD